MQVDVCDIHRGIIMPANKSDKDGVNPGGAPPRLMARAARAG